MLPSQFIIKACMLKDQDVIKLTNFTALLKLYLGNCLFFLILFFFWCLCVPLRITVTTSVFGDLPRFLLRRQQFGPRLVQMSTQEKITFFPHILGNTKSG